MLRFQLVILVLGVFMNTYGQDIGTVQVLGRYENGAVQLRWAPSDPQLWQEGLRVGYTVERFLLPSVEALEIGKPQGQTLNSEAIKAYEPAAFDTLIAKDGRAEALRALLYETGPYTTAGETPASLLARQQEIENSFALSLLLTDLSPRLARSVGLYWADRVPQAGERYIYRVSLAQEVNLPYRPGVLLVEAKEEGPLPPLKEVEADFRDRQVTIRWPVFLHRGVYTAYQIERSEDARHFEARHDFPYVQLENQDKPDYFYFEDSLKENNHTYYYRVRGITPFGELGPPSEMMEGKGRSSLTGVLRISDYKVVENKSVELQWAFPDSLNKLLTGFDLQVSSKAEGPYQSVQENAFPSRTRSFQGEAPYLNNYFRVRAIGPDGEELTRSFPYLVQLEDNDPPQVPTALEAHATKRGVVFLRWQANQEPDLKGYRVFKAYQPDNEFVEITTRLAEQARYPDTLVLESLKRKVYYRVVAVDRHYNNSSFSEILVVDFPDIIAPSAPQFGKVEIVGDTIHLAWANSHSPDVARYELHRFSFSEKTLERLSAWDASQNTQAYSDIPFAKKDTFQYYLYAYDSSANEALATSKRIPFTQAATLNLQDLHYEISPDDQAVRVQWKAIDPLYKPQQVIVFRAREEGSLKLYRRLLGSTRFFIEEELEPDALYRYRLKVIYEDGQASPLSEELRVVVERN